MAKEPKVEQDINSHIDALVAESQKLGMQMDEIRAKRLALRKHIDAAIVEREAKAKQKVAG